MQPVPREVNAVKLVHETKLALLTSLTWHRTYSGFCLIVGTQLSDEKPLELQVY